MFDIRNAALVTHQNCCDGSTCAILFVAAGGKRENIFFSSPNHNDTDELVEDLVERWEGSIVIADASISSTAASRIMRNDVFLLDHHKSAIPLEKFSWCEIDVKNTRCGAMMLFDWLRQYAITTQFLEYKSLVDLVDDHDRWVHHIENSEQNALFYELLGQKKYIDRFLKDTNPTLNALEHYALNLEIDKRDSYIEYKMKNVTVLDKTIQGHKIKVAYVASGIHQSRLGNMIVEDPKIGADVCILVGSSISMRASKTCPVDLSVVAKTLGGGGHRAAGGCSIEKFLNNNSLLDIIINHEIWNNL